jgi:hypothetical protein
LFCLSAAQANAATIETFPECFNRFSLRNSGKIAEACVTMFEHACDKPGMPRDEDFAKRLKQAVIDAQAAHDRRIASGAGKGSKGQLGLEDLSRDIAERESFKAKKKRKRAEAEGVDGDETTPYLHREKLDRLESAQLKTPLTVQELVLLDLLLRETGQEGLAALLRRRNWVDSVVVTGNVLFVVGSQVHNYIGREGDFIVAYDLRAVTQLLRDLDRRAATPVDPDILYSSSRYPPIVDAERPPLGRLLPSATVPTVFVGSPATNPMTETACAEVLGFAPWSPAPAKVPFWFAWPGQMAIRSSFTNPSRSEVLEGSTRVFSFAGEEHTVDRDQGATHGVVVLGQLDRPVVILMGITAAATYASSVVASSINEEFPPRGEAVIAHVQAQTDLDPAQPGADKRTIRDPHVIGVRRWSARKQSWVQRP